MIAVMAVAAISANAQTWIGGNIGFNTEKTSVEGNKLSSNSTFEFAPEIGYNLSDNWAVAMQIGYAHNGNGVINFADYDYEGIKNSFSIKPYVRYTFCKAGNFSAFVDGGISYTTAHISGVDPNLNSFGVAVKPGVAYAVSPKVSLVAHIGNLGYDYTWVKENNTTVSNNAFDVKLFNSISFGAYYNF